MFTVLEFTVFDVLRPLFQSCVSGGTFDVSV